MKPIGKLLIFSAIPSIIVVTFVGLGYLLGRYTIKRQFNELIKADSRAYYLGNLLQGDQKNTTARAYHDADNFLEVVDDISWAVPNILTPFVGGAPMPGWHGVAHINSMQFRATTDLEIPKPRGLFRIFLTGGSSAYGSGAPSNSQTIGGYLSAILREKLSPSTKLRYEVLTMANAAWASTHERIVIENRLSEMEPNMIISFSGTNDVHWGEFGRDVLWFRTYFDTFILHLIKIAYEITGEPFTPAVVQIAPNPIPPSVVAKRILKNVELSSFVLSMVGVDYFFFLQPTLAVTRKNLTKREMAFLGENRTYYQECYAQIDMALRSFHAENFRYANLASIFDNVSDQDELFLDSNHFGDKGNEMLAQEIFRHISGWLSE